MRRKHVLPGQPLTGPASFCSGDLIQPCATYHQEIAREIAAKKVLELSEDTAAVVRKLSKCNEGAGVQRSGLSQPSFAILGGATLYKQASSSLTVNSFARPCSTTRPNSTFRVNSSCPPRLDLAATQLTISRPFC